MGLSAHCNNGRWNVEESLLKKVTTFAVSFGYTSGTILLV